MSSKTEDVCEFLRRTEFFADLTPRTLAELAHNIEIKQFEKDAEIVRQGDEGREFFMVTEGSVAIVRSENGKDETLNRLNAGSYFGEVALIKNQPRNASVIATEPTTCYVLDREEFRAVVDASDSFGSELRKSVVRAQLGVRRQCPI